MNRVQGPREHKGRALRPAALAPALRPWSAGMLRVLRAAAAASDKLGMATALPIGVPPGSPPGLCRPLRSALGELGAHATAVGGSYGRTAGRMILFFVLGFWDKDTGAGVMLYRRDVPATTRL